MTAARLIALACIGCLCRISLASADTGAAASAEASAFGDLVPYDLEGDRTLEALEALAPGAPAQRSTGSERERAFVRSLGLADLWIIGHATARDRLIERVAQQLGADRRAAPASLDQALAALDNEAVRDVVSDARQAVRLTQDPNLSVTDLGRLGPRSQTLFVSRVLAAVAAAGTPPRVVAALAPLAPDPCNDGAACDPLYATFDAPGRRAVHALAIALRSLATFEREAADPFVRALQPTLAGQAEQLARVEIAPNPRWSPAAPRAHATEAGETRAPDLVVLVAPGRLEYGFVPRIRVGEGRLELVARGAPMFPESRVVPLAREFAPFVRSIDEVVQALSPLRATAPRLRVAVGAVPELAAHVWARALLSAQAAGFEDLAMLGSGKSGEMRSIDVEVVGPLRAAEVGPRELSVVVRLGGFSVKRAGPTVTIPRVKRDTGFAFDFDGLLTSARPDRAKSAKLSFMSDVGADTLAEAAFLMAPRDRALTVVLP